MEPTDPAIAEKRAKKAEQQRRFRANKRVEALAELEELTPKEKARIASAILPGFGDWEPEFMAAHREWLAKRRK